MPKSLSTLFCCNKILSLNSLPVLNVYVQVDDDKHLILFLEDKRPIFFQKNVTKIQKLCKISPVERKITIA